MNLPQEPRKTATARNMAVFIDADNLNDATALDHVLTDLRHRAERVLYKRAYGRVDSLKGIESVLWRHGVRPVSNMIVNKVTTDSALVIDAVEAVCTQDIDTVAICSGDADFVPLATYVRERGCHVLCFSLSNKIFANPESFYDEVTLLEVVEKPQGVAVAEVAPLAVAATSQPAVVDVAEVAHVPVGASTVESRLEPLQSSIQEMIDLVLKEIPSLNSGQSQHLSQVVAVLRQKGILGKTTKTSAWFSKLGAFFQLTPAQKPNQIAYNPGAHAREAAVDSVDTVSSPPAAPVPDMVQRVLKAVPDLRYGPQMLSQVVPVLRQKTILGKTTKSTIFFGQLSAHFKLSPEGQPTQVTYMVPRSSRATARAPQ